MPTRAPAPPERHADRLRRACATLSSPPPPPRVRVRVKPDGRVAFPGVVAYRVHRWNAARRAYEPAETVDLPPTLDSHPDPDAAIAYARLGKMYAGRPTTLPYRVVVADLAAYDRLKASGLLDSGHRLPTPSD